MRTWEDQPVKILLDGELAQGEYTLSFAAGECHYDLNTSQSREAKLPPHYTYFSCQSDTLGQHEYTLLAPSKRAEQTQKGIIEVKPLQHKLQLNLSPQNAQVNQRT